MSCLFIVFQVMPEELHWRLEGRIVKPGIGAGIDDEISASSVFCRFCDPGGHCTRGQRWIAPAHRADDLAKQRRGRNRRIAKAVAEFAGVWIARKNRHDKSQQVHGEQDTSEKMSNSSYESEKKRHAEK